ncbi:MAG: DegT/DnrJ/EryC1/StrS family aminotransferase [Polyangiales bacterium]
MINLADPAREHAHHQDEIEAAALRVMRSGVFILGPEVEAFQQEFAAYCGARRVVGVSNGSDAIVVALQALGVGPGDEVITTAFSYFATASAIVRAGATPVFADIDLASFDIDPADVERRITARTKAIVAVHLFGRMADTDALGALASKRGLKLIEDVAQAAGAERHGRRAGTVGDVGTFSFFPAKPLGCDGDGGACATNDDAVADAMTRVRVTGATAKNVHELPGGNYRLAPLQAAILRAKLPHYEGRLAKRRANAEVLRQGLRGVSELLVLPEEDAEGRHVYAQFTVRHPKRDALSAALRVRGVASEVYYPVPMPYQKVLSSLGHRAGEFPNTERACAEVLSIPVHSELSDGDVVRVVEAMRASLAEVESH